MTGRTAFDRAACAAAAPHARYYPCNETLRPLFYTGYAVACAGLCRRAGAVSAPGQLPAEKPAHRHQGAACRAGPVTVTPSCALRAGRRWTRGPLLRPVIDRMFPYKLYCKRLAAQLGVTGHIRYTGPLDAAAMRQAYLEADVFLLPSSCENSPQQLGRGHAAGPALRRQRRGWYSFDAGERHRGAFVRRRAGRRCAGPRRLRVLHSPTAVRPWAWRPVPAHCRPMMRPATPPLICSHIYESILQEEHP